MHFMWKPGIQKIFCSLNFFPWIYFTQFSIRMNAIFRICTEGPNAGKRVSIFFYLCPSLTLIKYRKSFLKIYLNLPVFFHKIRNKLNVSKVVSLYNKKKL